MRLLIAEDDRVTLRRLAGLATRWGYQTETAATGSDAAARLCGDAPPDIALLNWMLPSLDGPEVCRRVRAVERRTRPYLIILTAKAARDDVIAGLEAGADEYLLKPFDTGELRARLAAAGRIVALEANLSAYAQELETALANIRQLKGLVPICAYCKSIRDDADYWHRIEEYITDRSHVQFTHGICPKCLARLEGELTETDERT